MNKEELLAAIRKIIGNKKFTFSDAYINECKGTPTIGNNERRYYAITKKYLFVEECWGVFGYSETDNDYGWFFRRFPIFYRIGSGKHINKVPLDEVFASDLEKILRDIKFFFWWENNVNLPKLKKAYEDSLKYKPTFDKLKLSAEDIESFENL